MHGGAMVVNAATMGNITSLNDYVNMTVQQNGGAYAFANLSANIGVQAGYSAMMISAPAHWPLRASTR